MKINLLVISVLFVFFFQKAQSKDRNYTHNFKIVGKTKVQFQDPSLGEKMVEYDPDTPDHLFITAFDKDGNVTSKWRFLFTGKKFDLSADFLEYVKMKEITADGFAIQNKDGAIQSTQLYKKGILLEKVLYYTNGQKQSSISCQNESLNGEYKLWASNGQLSFSGNYTNNVKNGAFELYGESGALIKKGVYLEGKLVSGEAVVLDIVYTNPDIPAKYKSGEAAFNEYLSQRAIELETSKVIPVNKKISLDIITDKNGKIVRLQNVSRSTPIEWALINSLFKNCPDFSPATVENIPVQSIRKMTLAFFKEGIKTKQEEKIYTIVDKMPEFPGGTEGLRRYVAASVKYPIEAMKAGIQGTVFVSYIVDREGNVVEAKVVRGIHQLLDQEALRVVETLPKYIPGKSNGETVRVSYTVPITFAFR